MCKFSSESKSKLGNIMVYIANNANMPCKTKALKLLYLIEERFVLTYHTPFTGLPFEVWRLGPVEKDVFVELSDGTAMLGGYVVMAMGANGLYLKAAADFDEDEFSDNELAVMNEVISKYGEKTAKELVDITHGKNGLWYKTAKENGLIDAFNKNECNSSNVVIDFSKHLAPCDAEFYKEMLADCKAANYYGV